MATLTSRLKLKKPATTDTISIGDLNGNFDLLDANPGIFICTSTTRPASPFNGQTIYETDTNKHLVYEDTKWVSISSDSWTSLSMGTGWTIGTGWAGPSVKRIGDLVFFRSSYWNQTGSASLSTGVTYQIATVPDGFRPPNSTMLGGFVGRGNNTPFYGYIRVNPDGAFSMVPYQAVTVDSSGHSGNHVIPASGIWYSEQ